MAEFPFRGEEELFAKLEKWLAARNGSPTVFDIIETGDAELIAAYVLKAFRAEARQAVIDHLNRHLREDPDCLSAANPALRVFAGLRLAWSLSREEQLGLLGIDSLAELKMLKQMPVEEVPVAIVERLCILLDIFEAINTLLPLPERAGAWVRKANGRPLFGGRPPLSLMMESLEALRLVRQYLRAEIWSR